MKMTIIKCMKAYKAILELENEKLDFSTAHTLVMGKRALEPHAEFYTGKEQEIVKRYAIPDKDGNLFTANGQFKMSANSTTDFMRDKAELDAVEVEVEIKGKIKRLPEVKPSVLDALIDVFEFSD